MAEFKCRCVPEGQPSPHSNYEQCAASRQSTADYLSRINFPAFVETRDEREIRLAQEARSSEEV